MGPIIALFALIAVILLGAIFGMTRPKKKPMAPEVQSANGIIITGLIAVLALAIFVIVMVATHSGPAQ
jgi:hypothetical protein